MKDNNKNVDVNSEIDILKDTIEMLKGDLFYVSKQLIDKQNKANDIMSSLREVNTEQAIYKKVLNVTYNCNQWFKSNNKLIVKENEFESLLDDEFAYCSYRERNTNFSLTPKEKIIDINYEYDYKISFKGEKTGDIKAQLFIIYYTDKIKVAVQVVELNKQVKMSFNKDIKGIRLAIRISKKGTLKINEIIIDRRPKLKKLSLKDVRNLGYDVPKNLNELKIACIFDEFTMQCYKYEAQLNPITPEDWRAKFLFNPPHMLMIESAWHGNNGTWNRKISATENNSLEDINEVIQWCKGNNIPTIFWNKEDPIHFESFKRVAKLVDYIFTTDKDIIPKYREYVGHNRVYPLMFAAQPKIHNPIEIVEEKSEKVCFAGSYYTSKYDQRKHDMDELLEGCFEQGIAIYDRNFNDNNPEFYFPEKFRNFILGKLQGEDIIIAYKGYKYMLNVNSVKESSTMFSRRVFEGIACGSIVISSYSKAIEEVFKNIVVICNSADEVKNKLNIFNNNNILCKEVVKLGLREVLKYHTYEERLYEITSKVGIVIENKRENTAVLCKINNTDELKNIIQIFNSQSIENKKLFIMTNDNNVIQEAQLNNIQVIRDLDEKIINIFSQCSYLVFLEANKIYEQYFIEDMELSFKYADATVIGTTEENRYYYSTDVNLKESVIRVSHIYTVTLKELMDIIRKNNCNYFIKKGLRIFLKGC